MNYVAHFLFRRALTREYISSHKDISCSCAQHRISGVKMWFESTTLCRLAAVKVQRDSRDSFTTWLDVRRDPAHADAYK